jgi:hypothetical protein
MTFPEYIDLIGVPKFSRIHNVTDANVYKWRNLETSPRPEMAYQIICLSNGVLTWEKIYQPYIEKVLRGKKVEVNVVDGTPTQLEFNFPKHNN